MARRIEIDAWPLMTRLLRTGLPSSGSLMSPRASLMILEPGQSDKGLATSPAADLRVREGVLSCLGSLADNEPSRGAIGRMAQDMGTEVAVFLGEKQPQGLRSLASDALLALAKVDSDAVWMILTDLANAGRPSGVFSQTPDGIPAKADILPPSQKVARDAEEGARVTLERLEAWEAQGGTCMW
jgi:hypothetical protein